ncbi:Arylamine N-acetyltransferase [Fusarium oxysporum f. sp. albedinis]|nr:Arylamine N-acetyltransferase [Fusarium oxysporum f. sp. albedinis]
MTERPVYNSEDLLPRSHFYRDWNVKMPYHVRILHVACLVPWRSSTVGGYVAPRHDAAIHVAFSHSLTLSHPGKVANLQVEL